MTLDDLSVDFTQFDRESLLSDWRWLIGADKLPILVTVAGDAFLQDRVDGTVHFLDTGTGCLSIVADSVDTFLPLLDDKHFVVNYFSFELVAPLLRSGIAPAAGEVFSFDIPPFLGGESAPSNLKPTHMAVHFSMFGQLLEQVKDLPPGTPITEIKWVDG